MASPAKDAKQEAQLSLGWANRTVCISEGQRDFCGRKKRFFSGDAAISKATINGNSAHMADGCKQKLCI